MNPSTDPIPTAPSPAYEKFFARQSEHVTISTDQWNLTHLIGYFAALYRQTYGIDYTFRMNSSAPTKSYESFQMGKLGKQLSRDPLILRGYIDWFFADKLVARKRRITSMSFLTDAAVVNEYKLRFLMVSRDSTIDRTTVLQPNVLAITSPLCPDVRTYGELAFMRLYVAGQQQPTAEHVQMFERLAASGFDLTLLDRVR